nr:GNAT family N-acetyltransferase [Phycicoccus sp.]
MPSHLIVGPALDAARYLATDQLVWFVEDEDLPVEVLLNGVPESGRFAAQDPDSDPATYPGVYGVTPLELAVPGLVGRAHSVPCAGLTFVGVHPDHRRRGILTAMMRDHCARSHEAGVVVSALHASEPLIYGRHGYGLASLEHVVTWSRGATFTAPGLDEDAKSVRVRLA